MKLSSKSGKETLAYIQHKDVLREFMKVMSLAHECVRESVKENEYFYRGPSPDEVTLVEFAKSLGFTFLGETEHTTTVGIQNY